MTTQKKYRPDGWENPYYTQNSSDFENSQRSKAFEAGADAMLEGLKKEGIKQLLQDPVLHYQEWHGKWGTICFLEEE